MAARATRMERSIAAAAAMIWIAALFLPALRIQDEVYAGWGLFVIGPLGVVMGYPDWLGNVALLAAECVIWFRGPRAWRLGAAAGLLVLAAVAVTRRELPMDEGGFPHEVQAWLPAFYLWLTSLLLPVAALFRQDKEAFS